MFEDYNKYKVLKVFLDNPTEGFRLRELSRKVGIAPTSISNYLNQLKKEGLITIQIKEGINYYKANRDNTKFAIYQKISNQYELYGSGVIDAIWEESNPEAVIFYGSYAKGEAIENSDLDIFVVGKQKEINLEKYEKILGKKIHLIFMLRDKIPNELKNNLANGIIMKGYFRVV